MSNQLALLEITCDAPPYEIVRASERLGFSSPLDVRWCRMNRSACKGKGWLRRLCDHPWQALRSLRQPNKPRCICGHDLPDLRSFEYRLIFGGKTDFLLGQCPRCRTMFWDEA